MGDYARLGRGASSISKYPFQPPDYSRFFGAGQGRLGANTAILSLAVIGFSNRQLPGLPHHKRIDLTSEKLYSLSPQTRKIVSGLQKDVKIIKFDKEDVADLRDR
jgi:hypothetical protein